MHHAPVRLRCGHLATCRGIVLFALSLVGHNHSWASRPTPTLLSGAILVPVVVELVWTAMVESCLMAVTVLQVAA